MDLRNSEKTTGHPRWSATSVASQMLGTAVPFVSYSAKGTRLSVEDRATWAEAIVRRKGQLDIGATEYRPNPRPRKDKGPSDVSLSPLAKCNLRMPSVGISNLPHRFEAHAPTLDAP